MAPVNLKAATKVYCSLLFNHINPSPCTLCGQSESGALCVDCLHLLARLSVPVCRCGLPHGNEQPVEADSVPPLCGRCIRQPPPFSASQAPLQYTFPIDALITRYKHRADLTVERALAPLLAETPLPWADTDAVCPLPVHWRRRWRRGFDQGDHLARLMGQYWQRPVLPALVRQRATASQQGLSRRQRQRNLRQAFHCQHPVTGLRLILVDDVMTTGSSARAAAQCLLDHGAKDVRVWTLARTLPPPLA
jgi:ComF family protein